MQNHEKIGLLFQGPFQLQKVKYTQQFHTVHNTKNLQHTTIGVTDTSDIIDTIESFFEVGISKDTTVLKDIQLNDPRFASFSDVPPFDLKDFDTTLMLETLRFVSISDYSYTLIRPKISIFGDTAIVATGLNQKGMLVDNKNYTGEHISIDGRATFVLARIDSSWKIVHIHLSKSQ